MKKIKRLDADNEEDLANAPSFYNYLSEIDKGTVDKTFDIVRKYIRNNDGTPNQRAITQMNKRGYVTSLRSALSSRG